MKKLLLLFAIFHVVSMHSQVNDIKPEPNVVSVVTTAQVLSMNGNKAQIMISYSKKYEISIIPVLNPFGYLMEADREYTVCLERDLNQVNQFQTQGQTRTLPAKLIWFAPSEWQLKRDKMMMMKQVNNVRDPVNVPLDN